MQIVVSFEKKYNYSISILCVACLYYSNSLTGSLTTAGKNAGLKFLYLIRTDIC